MAGNEGTERAGGKTTTTTRSKQENVTLQAASPADQAGTQAQATAPKARAKSAAGGAKVKKKAGAKGKARAAGASAAKAKGGTQRKAKTKTKAKAKTATKAGPKVAAKAFSAAAQAADGNVTAPAIKGPNERALVVVESPAKAKTIKKYLGRGYTVKASVGHVKDLPKSKLAVDIEHDFAPVYETIRGKSKVLKEIKDAAKEADVIYLAPDPDREGEAIAWHIADELGKRFVGRVHRITFNEITKQAVLQAVQNPQPLNRPKFDSQQARRVLDRIVGYQISPILWDKVRRGLSAGRVQSVAVRLVVEREAKVLAFVPEEYWRLQAALQTQAGAALQAEVVRHREDKFRPGAAEAIEVATKALQGADFVVRGVQRRERRRKPLAPLITSKLQQEAASRLRFTAKRTMMVAQQLYEGVELGEEGAVALITYMRTDSTRVSPVATEAVRTLIAERYGPDYLPAEPPVYRSKKSAQDAHEAIRPTSLEHPPERVRAHLTPEQYKLYCLIWRFFVASQMVPAVFDQTSVEIGAGDYTLRTGGAQRKFAGFLAVHEDTALGAVVEAEPTDADDSTRAERAGNADPAADKAEASDFDPASEQVGELPAEIARLEVGAPLQCVKLSPSQHFTQPPPRFSEATLVRELEEQGIGRPSTYAAILSTIVTRGYVTKDEGRFRPTELGLLVTELLLASFPQIMDVAFTADMESKLDSVETGEVDWVALLRTFYNGGFADDLTRAKTEMRDVKREETPTEHVCEDCGQPMVIKWGRNGSFLACAGYPGCRNTRDYVRQPDGSLKLVPEVETDARCPTCGGGMVVKRGRFGQFVACANYPTCKGTRPMSIGVDCPNNCGNYLAERRSKRGRTFYGCAGYPDCTFVLWDRPVPGPCPDCKAPYLLRKYTRKDGVTIRCGNKACGYTRDPELDDADAQAVAG